MERNQQLRELLDEILEERRGYNTNEMSLLADRFQPVDDFPVVRERFQVIQELLTEVLYDLQRTRNKDQVWTHTVSDYSELLDYVMRELEELGGKDARFGGAA